MEKKTQDIRYKIINYDIAKLVGLFLGCASAVLAAAVNILFVVSNDNRSTLHLVLVTVTNSLAIVFGIIAIVFTYLSQKLKKELAHRRAEAYKKLNRKRRPYLPFGVGINHDIDVDAVDEEDLIAAANEPAPLEVPSEAPAEVPEVPPLKTPEAVPAEVPEVPPLKTSSKKPSKATSKKSSKAPEKKAESEDKNN